MTPNTKRTTKIDRCLTFFTVRLLSLSFDIATALISNIQYFVKESGVVFKIAVDPFDGAKPRSKPAPIEVEGSTLNKPRHLCRGGRRVDIFSAKE
jgi:hypothetical protein